MFAVQGLLYEVVGDRIVFHAMPLLLAALCVIAIAYRYYSAFLAARVAVLDDSRITPAHRFNDGQNYHPTNKWVLFGHHFAAISGAGPLIGPVLAIQYGYLPGLLWLVIGVCLAGAVQDMLVLAASVRRDGKSLAEIARHRAGRLRLRRRVGGHPVHRHHRPGRPGLRRRQGARRRRRQSRPGHDITIAAGNNRSTPAEHPSLWLSAGRLPVRYTNDERPKHPAPAVRGAPAQRRRTSACRRLHRGRHPAGEVRAGRAGQFLGHVHHRLHHSHRPVRRPVHVPDPQGQCRGGVADRCGGDAGRRGRGQLDSRFARGRRASR